MTSELLQREEEYIKLNKKLELRSKELKREFESVLKKQDDILQDMLLKPQDTLTFSNISGCSKNIKKIFPKLNAAEDVEIDESLVPKSVDEMGTRAMSTFYKAKIKAMHADYEKLQIEYRMKTDELRNTLNESKKLTEEKEKWFTAFSSNKNQICKLENQISALNSKVQSKELENSSLKKEVEQLKKEIKTVTQNSSGNEIKINRLLEENDKLKAALQSAKHEENSLKSQHRKQVDELTALLKNVEKQKFELVSAFKKQVLLIDNLKKQKALYESQKLAEIADKEFMKILEWNSKNQP